MLERNKTECADSSDVFSYAQQDIKCFICAELGRVLLFATRNLLILSRFISLEHNFSSTRYDNC